jgi:hypothetical protein
MNTRRSTILAKAAQQLARARKALGPQPPPPPVHPWLQHNERRP